MWGEQSEPQVSTPQLAFISSLINFVYLVKSLFYLHVIMSFTT